MSKELGPRLTNEGTDWAEYHLKKGLHYGYPKCCISYFIANFDSLPEINESRKLKFAGYVPCPLHYAKKEKEETNR